MDYGLKKLFDHIIYCNPLSGHRLQAEEDVLNCICYCQQFVFADTGLKKLLDRIRHQREEWVSRSTTGAEDDAKTGV